MNQSAKDKKIYPPYLDGKRVLCSRCFDTLSSILKYGHDEEGYWFIAPCRSCGAKMKWYRGKDGTPAAQAVEREEATFGLTIVEGELTLIMEEE